MHSSLILKTRREFLRSTVLGGALTWTVPSFLAQTLSALQAAAADRAIQTVTGKDGPILVVLQMAGGNDGLNTVVPFGNDHYQRARPTIGISDKTVLKLTDEIGLHPGMAEFKELFEHGHLAIIQGVGYPNPNRSHFRSTEIWQTASDSQRVERYGWLGRYFDNACRGADPTVGVSIGRQTPQAFASPTPAGISFDNPQNYRFVGLDKTDRGRKVSSETVFRELNRPDHLSMESTNDLNSGASIGAVQGRAVAASSPLDYLERVALDAQVSSDRILAITKKGMNQSVYPASSLANSLKLVASLIGGGLPSRVFYVSQGGYDTHTNQFGTHERLLKELAGAIKAFVEDLSRCHAFRTALWRVKLRGRRQSAKRGLARAQTAH